MGYQVYWVNNRWQGYGVPAYCDYPGCKEEIDRGMGYSHLEDSEGMTPNIFSCKKHESESPDSFEIDLKKEHPEWLNHILNDKSWNQWRTENPDIVTKYKELNQRLNITSM